MNASSPTVAANRDRARTAARFAARFAAVIDPMMAASASPGDRDAGGGAPGGGGAERAAAPRGKQ